MKQREIVLNEERNVRLVPYILECGGEFTHTRKRPAVLVVPGGAYLYCSAREAEPVALAYNAAGYHAFVLYYSVGKDVGDFAPLCDFDAAMEHILCHAEEYGVECGKIAAIGFSAGGHLVACASAMAEHRPFASILGYPVTSSKLQRVLNFLLPVAAEAVCPGMHPVFLFSSRTDILVDASDTAEFLEALCLAGVSYECRTYSFAEHGFSLGTYEMIGDGEGQCCRVGDWFPASLSWLREAERGLLRRPLVGAQRDGRTPFLSIRNSTSYLFGNKTARELTEAVLDGVPLSDGEFAAPLSHVLWGRKIGLSRIRGLERELSHIRDDRFPLEEIFDEMAKSANRR